MKSNVTQFCFPSRVGDAARLMARLGGKAAVVAGGTRHTHRIAATVSTVIDLTDLPLRHIKADKSWLHIGSLATIDSLEKSPAVKAWARGVIAATAGFGSNHFARVMGTVGGNVVRPHPFNNLPPVFLALDGQAVCTDGRKERVLPFADLLKSDIMAKLGRRLLLTEIRVPAATRSWAAATQRLAQMKTDWESYANCVAALDIKDGTIRSASIAIGALVPRASRLGRTERALAGRPASVETVRAATAVASAELAELTGGTSEKAYGREIAAVLVRRALLEAIQ